MIKRSYAPIRPFPDWARRVPTEDEWAAVRRVHLVPHNKRVSLCGEVISEGPASGVPWMPVSIYGEDIKKIAGEGYTWCVACHESPDLPLALLGEL
jgi:hypothetical protein